MPEQHTQDEAEAIVLVAFSAVDLLTRLAAQTNICGHCFLIETAALIIRMVATDDEGNSIEDVLDRVVEALTEVEEETLH